MVDTTVRPDHEPEHLFICGGCGARNDDVTTGHPPCVGGAVPHLWPPEPGYPLPEWLDANDTHPPHAGFIARVAEAMSQGQPRSAAAPGPQQRRARSFR